MGTSNQHCNGVSACRRNRVLVLVLVLAEKAFGVRLRPAKAGLRRDGFSRFAEREQRVAKSEFGLASELQF